MKLFKVKKVSEKKYYESHLHIVNVLLPIKMTPTEIKVLSRFMMLKGDIAESRFGATAKKMVKKDLKLSSAGLSNHLKHLNDKGFITTKDNVTEILSILIPDEDNQEYSIRLKINESTK